MGASRTVDVDPGNAGQLGAWDGAQGAFWAAQADRFDRAVARYDAAFLAAARLRPGDRVLDVGCGTGATTRAAGRVTGSALGVDLSSAMLEVARQRAAAEGLDGVRFEQADAQVAPFPAEGFDVAVSRTGAMFFADPVAALANVGRALVPGGRLVLLVWRALEENEWMSEVLGALSAGRPLPVPPPGAPGPFSLADPGRVREVLTAAGHRQVEVEGLAEPEWFGADPDDALTFVLGFAGWLLDGLDDDARASAVADLRRRIEAHAGPGGVEFGSAAWLVTARR
ncbi:Methyltransferase domain-containing protein [Geodermatophilus amargosae]|uniref:Methyltransferase domain-containing protein n=1 Tax=Geodermatophilus amargosae TaxID=1296565 RepID=A0A1I6YR48_9ACTN|nr:methyltransferase domain-containing protein [Geodermatophilus amargosae]SFT52874.1 Methyltransferase domain-containing protein [Geodermatophilus amargosae]